jgi:hypothetical protein
LTPSRDCSWFWRWSSHLWPETFLEKTHHINHGSTRWLLIPHLFNHLIIRSHHKRPISFFFFYL